MKKILLLAALCSVSGFAMAKTENIHFVWKVYDPEKPTDPESGVITNVNVIAAPVICSGLTDESDPKGYTYAGFESYNAWPNFQIKVDGIYDGDHRTLCEVNSAGTLIDTYFDMQDILISYVYNGVPDKCEIRENIGLGYEGITPYNENKLQGSNPNEMMDCGRTQAGIKYQLTPGHDNPTYDAGYITLYLPQQESSAS